MNLEVSRDDSATPAVYSVQGLERRGVDVVPFKKGSRNIVLYLVG